MEQPATQWWTAEAWKALLLRGEAPPPEVGLRKGYIAHIDRTAKDDARRTLGFTISTGAVDRERDTIDPKGWKTDNYEKNPVVLWAHSYRDLPIGRSVALSTTQTALKSKAEFVPADVHPFAETVYQMLLGGFLNATSVGFRPEKHAYVEERRGVDFMEQELLEYSVVPVPANPEALLDAKGQGIDVAPLRQWAERVLDGFEPGGIWVPRSAVEQVFRLAGPERRISVPSKLTIWMDKNGVRIEPDAAEEAEWEPHPSLAWTEAESKPFPNEHACRLADPGSFSEFRRQNGARTHDGKKYDVIYGKRKDDGKWADASFRYPKEAWTAAQAKSHCGSHSGTFEAAKGPAPGSPDPCPHGQCPKQPEHTTCPAGNECPIQGHSQSGLDATEQADQSEVVLRLTFEDVEEPVLRLVDALEEQDVTVPPEKMREAVRQVFAEQVAAAVRDGLRRLTGRLD